MGNRLPRPPAGQHCDVTRLEHENLCGQVDEMLRMLRCIQAELHAQNDRLVAVESLIRSTKVLR